MTTPTHAIDSGELEWPCERFYWAVLDEPGAPAPGINLPSSSPSAAALNSMLEEHLPVPIEDVHVLYRRLDGQRVLACAAACDAIAAIDPRIITLRPQTLPQFIASGIAPGSINPDSIDMLVGPFEAPLVRKERSKNHWMLAASVLAVAGLLIIGLVRRERGWNRDLELTHAAYATLAGRVFTDGTSPGTPTDALVRIRGDINDAKRLVETPDPNAASGPDAAQVISELLSNWPKDAEARTELLSATPGSIAMNIEVDRDAKAFISGLVPPSGWATEPPRLNAGRGTTQLSIQLRKLTAVAESRGGTP